MLMCGDVCVAACVVKALDTRRSQFCIQHQHSKAAFCVPFIILHSLSRPLFVLSAMPHASLTTPITRTGCCAAPAEHAAVFRQALYSAGRGAAQGEGAKGPAGLCGGTRRGRGHAALQQVPGTCVVWNMLDECVCLGVSTCWLGWVCFQLFAASSCTQKQRISSCCIAQDARPSFLCRRCDTIACNAVSCRAVTSHMYTHRARCRCLRVSCSCCWRSAWLVGPCHKRPAQRLWQTRGCCRHSHAASEHDMGGGGVWGAHGWVVLAVSW